MNSNTDKKLTQKEIYHFFYYMGAADGILKTFTIEGKNNPKPDFKKRYKEFLKGNKKTNL